MWGKRKTRCVVSEKSREESDWRRNGSEEKHTIWCASFVSPEKRAQDENLGAGLFLGGNPKKLDQKSEEKARERVKINKMCIIEQVITPGLHIIEDSLESFHQRNVDYMEYFSG